MPSQFAAHGADWLAEQVMGLTEEITHVSPSIFNEEVRYLPDSVTPLPGFISFDEPDDKE